MKLQAAIAAAFAARAGLAPREAQLMAAAPKRPCAKALSVSIESPKVPYLSDFKHVLVRKPHTLFGNMFWQLFYLDGTVGAQQTQNHDGARLLLFAKKCFSLKTKGKSQLTLSMGAYVARLENRAAKYRKTGARIDRQILGRKHG